MNRIEKQLQDFWIPLKRLNIPVFVVDVKTKTFLLANQAATNLPDLQEHINNINTEELYRINSEQKQKPTTKFLVKKHPEECFTSAIKNGDDTLVEIKLTPVSLQGEKLLFGIATNLTNIEKTLKQSISLFQTLFDENTLPILLVEPKTFVITEANYHARNFLGHSLGELRGTPLSKFSKIPRKRFNSILSDFIEKKYTGLEIPIKTPAGPRDVSIHYTYAHADDSIACLLILVDVTERNKAIEAIVTVKKNLAQEVEKQTSHLIELNNSLVEQIKQKEKVESELKRSETLFIRLFMANPNGMVLRNIYNGEATLANKNFLKMFRLKKDDIIGKKPKETKFLTNNESYNSCYKKLKKQESISDTPLTLLSNIGHPVFLTYSGEVINLESGKFTLEVFNDITNLEIAKQKLADSEEHYRSIFNNALVGIYRTEIETGIVIDSNKEYARILGYKNPSEIIGKEILSHYPDNETRERFIKTLKREKVAVFETSLKTKDNKTVWVVHHAQIYPERGYLEGVVTDITDRKLMEDMLVFSENRFRSLIENATDLILIVNENGEILYLSPSIKNELGYEIARKQRVNVKDYIDPRDLKKFQKTLASKTKSRKYHHVRVLHKNGHFLTYEFSARNLTSDPAIGGIIINAKDVTSQIKAKNEIDKALKKEQELNRQKTQFISTVSHEFRTPLTNISLNIQLLQKYIAEGKYENAETGLTRLKNATKRLTSILNEISMISKDQSGRLQYNPEAISNHQLIDELIDMQAYLILPYVEVQVNKSTECLVYADKSLIAHVLDNVISNAVKYSPQKGKIAVKIEHKAGFLEIIVKDNGIGIPKEERKFLFDPYFRASNVKQIQGTGLGLSIVKKCVDLHNGTLEMYSEQGKGTEVRCRFPLQTAP